MLGYRSTVALHAAAAAAAVSLVRLLACKEQEPTERVT